MRDIVTKVDTLPKNNRGGTSIRTKTKYKNFEDYAARLHHRDGSEESETCSATSYMLKSKFKSLGSSDLDLDKYKGRCYEQCIKDDQESVGSDDSGVGSISESKDHQNTKYAAYNEFLSGYRKKQEPPHAPKKVVRSEIFIQVGHEDLKDDSAPMQRQWSVDTIGRSNASSEGASSKIKLTKMQNFNSIPRKFEPTAYPKPEVACSLVKPVVPPNLSRSVSVKCDESDGGYEIVCKPKFPPAPVQLKHNLRSPIRKTVSNQFIPGSNYAAENPAPTLAVKNKQSVPQPQEINVRNETPFRIPAPPPFMDVQAPVIKCKPALGRATSNVSVVVNGKESIIQENVSITRKQSVLPAPQEINNKIEPPSCIPPPPPFMTLKTPLIKCKPALIRAASNDSVLNGTESILQDTLPAPANPMQMVFDEIRKRNTNLRQPVVVVSNTQPSKVTVNAVKTDETIISIPPPIPPPLTNQFAVKSVECGVVKPQTVSVPPPPPPPPMICDPSGSLRKLQPPQNGEIKATTQLLDKERKNANRPAPPPLQQELFKKLSEMNKKNQTEEETVENTQNNVRTARPEVHAQHKTTAAEDVTLPPVLPTQKYNTLSRFLDTEKECLQQQQYQSNNTSNTLERQDPKKKIVYNVYRDMLGSYNSKANGIVAALPSRMVREDQGVKKQLESL